MNLLEQFMTEFNLLHEAMKRYTRRDDNFGSLMYQLRNKHPVIKQYHDEIDLARQLRNLLVHEKKEFYNIAEPTEMFVNQLKLIRRKFENPETVRLFSKAVTTLNSNDSLKDALNKMRKHPVSQYPVFKENEFLGILTDNGVTKWLTSVSIRNSINLSDYSVKDILNRDDKDSSYIIVNHNFSLYEVEKKMTELVNEKGYSKLVILITSYGKITHKEDIIGIITPVDMPKILEYIR